MATAKVNVARLRREMLLRGWDGVDLAYHSGVSAATVSHAMQGHPISSTTIRKLVGALLRQPAITGADALLA